MACLPHAVQDVELEGGIRFSFFFPDPLTSKEEKAGRLRREFGHVRLDR